MIVAIPGHLRYYFFYVEAQPKMFGPFKLNKPVSLYRIVSENDNKFSMLI